MGSCCVSDPKPVCGPDGPPIRGQNVTLKCNMTYRRRQDKDHELQGAWSSASISWESAAGTLLKRTAKVLKLGSTEVGETLTVEVMTLASGTTIPSYNCTTEFEFTSKKKARYIYAHNNVSWTCVSSPVITWCMYLELS